MKKQYTLKFTGYPEYLYARVIGNEYSPEICKQWWKETFDEADKLGYKKILAHQNIREQLSPEEILELNKELLDIGFGRYKIAFVDDVSAQRDVNTLGEVMAQALNIKVRIFADINSARRWLLFE